MHCFFCSMVARALMFLSKLNTGQAFACFTSECLTQLIVDICRTG